jgi:uncharacterized integral membrane protein
MKMGGNRLVSVIAIVALVIALVLFVSENSQTVRVDLFVGTIEIGLGWAVVVSAVAGFLAGSTLRK